MGPTLSEGDSEGDDPLQIFFMALPCSVSLDLCLYPYRTPTTLYMPNPSFSHMTTHLLSLPRDRPIGQALARACGQGMSAQLGFELWRRFYFPNIRDQLLAKVRSAALEVRSMLVLVLSVF